MSACGVLRMLIELTRIQLEVHAKREPAIDKALDQYSIIHMFVFQCRLDNELSHVYIVHTYVLINGTVTSPEQ